MARQIIIGIMGPGREASARVRREAFTLGQAVAEQGWIVLTGGVNQGVMDAAARGAKKAKGTTIGIIPRPETMISSAIDIPIVTGLGSGRNIINALTCRALLICGINPGTTTEVAYALQFNKPVVFLNPEKTTKAFFKKVGGKSLVTATSAQSAVTLLKRILLKQT